MERFFDKMQQSVMTVSKEVIGKSKDLGNEAKIRATIIAEERKIKEQYKAIGEIYYKLHKDNHEDAFQVMVDKIKRSEKVINQAKKELYKDKPAKEYVKTEPCDSQSEQEDVIDYQFVEKETEVDDNQDTSEHDNQVRIKKQHNISSVKLEYCATFLF